MWLSWIVFYMTFHVITWYGLGVAVILNPYTVFNVVDCVTAFRHNLGLSSTFGVWL